MFYRAVAATCPGNSKEYNSNNIYLNSKYITEEYKSSEILLRQKKEQEGLQFYAIAEGFGAERYEDEASLIAVKKLEALHKTVSEEKISDESIAIMSLLHDVCKVNTYTVDYRNQKIDGQWVQVPYFAYNNSLPYGHGEKSVYIVSGYMRLTREEAMAINWHMGGFDPRNQNSSDMSDAFKKFPQAVLFHVSDLEATYLDENEN